MAIVRWNPWTLSQLMDDNFFDFKWEDTAPVNVSEDDDTIHVEMLLPGVKKDDVKITIEGSTLTARVDVKEEAEEKEKKYYRKEIKRQSFVRSIVLPTHVASDRAQASFEDGVLMLSLPKAEEAKPKEISLTA